jgi:hypothetical protein
MNQFFLKTSGLWRILEMIIIFVFLSMILVSHTCADWGRILVKKDSRGNLKVELQNSKLYTHYLGTYKDQNGYDMPHQVFMADLIHRAAHETQGSWLDAAEGRSLLQNANVTENSENIKTVRLEWNCATEEVSIFRDSPVLQIEYINTCSNILDLGSPGGNFRGVFISDEPIVHNDHYIIGVYNDTNGRGYGRVIPAANVTEINTINSNSFEIIPQGAPFKSYFFLIDGGEDGALARGKELAEGRIPSSPPVPLRVPLNKREATDIRPTLHMSKTALDTHTLPMNLFRQGVYILSLRTTMTSLAEKFMIVH